MSGHSRGGERSIHTGISSIPQDKHTISQAPVTSSDPLEAPPCSLGNTGRPPPACPVPTCPVVFKEGTPHRYLKRDLNHPGLHGRTGDKREAWVNLHKMEHERFLAALGSTPSHSPNPKEVLEVNQAAYVNVIKLIEDNRAEEESKSRTAKFELRGKDMGITEEKFVAQKVVIWEGMWAAKQNGDDIGVRISHSAPFSPL